MVYIIIIEMIKITSIQNNLFNLHFNFFFLCFYILWPLFFIYLYFCLIGEDLFDIKGNTSIKFQDLFLDDQILELMIFEDEDIYEEEDGNIQLVNEPG